MYFYQMHKQIIQTKFNRISHRIKWWMYLIMLHCAKFTVISLVSRHANAGVIFPCSETWSSVLARITHTVVFSFKENSMLEFWSYVFYKRILLNYCKIYRVILPISQFSPRKPGLQIQVWTSPVSTQVPPCRQGLHIQRSSTAKNILNQHFSWYEVWFEKNFFSVNERFNTLSYRSHNSLLGTQMGKYKCNCDFQVFHSKFLHFCKDYTYSGLRQQRIL